MTFPGCKPNITTSGIGPLQQAATRHLDIIADILIKYGASVTLKNLLGEVPLHSAARSGSWKCAEMFLMKGAKVDAQTDQGYAPLHIAAIYGHEKTVKVRQ